MGKLILFGIITINSFILYVLVDSSACDKDVMLPTCFLSMTIGGLISKLAE